MLENHSITIKTYVELLEREQELLERIIALPNGGQLYLLHPLLLFADVGAELAPDVQEEFATQHGGAGGWSEQPYRALRGSTSEQPSQVTMRGLFRRPS
jgi:hypothetical protein